MTKLAAIQSLERYVQHTQRYNSTLWKHAYYDESKGVKMSDGAAPVQVDRRCHRKFGISSDATQSDPRVSELFSSVGFSSVKVAGLSLLSLFQLTQVRPARMPALACLVLLVFCSSWSSAERVHGADIGKGQQSRRALRQTDRHGQTAGTVGRWGLLDLASQLVGEEQDPEGCVFEMCL